MITASDVENELNPQGSSTKFKADNYASAVQRAIDNAVSNVKANLPEQYRRMMNIHSGVVLTRHATAGQTEFDLPSGFVYTGGSVWKNHVGPWRDRKAVDAVEAAVLDGKAILLEPASEGDVYVGDFIPDGSVVPQLLKSYALQLACHELRRSIPSLVAETDRQSLDNDLIFLRNDLKDLRKNSLRLDEWDELYKNLIQDTQTVMPLRCNVIDVGGW